MVAAITAVPLLVSQAVLWADLRRRTNGNGPIAAEVRRVGERLARVEERVGRVEERLAAPVASASGRQRLRS